MTHGAAHDGGPAWLLVVAAAGVPLLAYLAAAAVVRSRTGRPWPLARTVVFAAGVLTLAVGLSPAAGDLAGSAARGHMAQHVLVGMLAPLGLVLGAPLTLALSAMPVAVRRRGTAVLRRRPVDVLVHPATAGALHVAGLYGLYLTPLHALALQRPDVHALALLHLGLTGCLLTFALVGPERAGRPPGLAWRVGVLVVASAAHGHVAKLLHLRAPAQASDPATVVELQDAARWMYAAGDVAEVLLAVALFAGWYRRAGRRRLTAFVPAAST